MRTIELGDGLRTSALGFGGMALTHVYGGTDRTSSALAVLNAAVDGASPSSTPPTSTALPRSAPQDRRAPTKSW